VDPIPGHPHDLDELLALQLFDRAQPVKFLDHERFKDGLQLTASLAPVTTQLDHRAQAKRPGLRFG